MAICALDKETVGLPSINLVKSVHLVAGIYELSLVVNSSVNENNTLTLDESNVQQLSPMLFDFSYLKGLKFKIHVYAAEYDSPLFVEQAGEFNNQLEKYEIDTTYKCLPGIDHMGIMEKFDENDFELTQLVLQELR